MRCIHCGAKGERLIVLCSGDIALSKDDTLNSRLLHIAGLAMLSYDNVAPTFEHNPAILLDEGEVRISTLEEGALSLREPHSADSESEKGRQAGEAWRLRP